MSRVKVLDEAPDARAEHHGEHGSDDERHDARQDHREEEGPDQGEAESKHLKKRHIDGGKGNVAIAANVDGRWGSGRLHIWRQS